MKSGKSALEANYEPSEQSHNQLDTLLSELMNYNLLENNDMHIGTTCDACTEENFFGYRYKCLICNNYDLCDDCFQARRISKSHTANHPVLVIANAIDRKRSQALQQLFELDAEKLLSMVKDIDHSAKCDGCQEPIKGVRLKCDDCFNFDLCWKCYKANKGAHRHEDTHTMIAHFLPVQNQFELDKVTQPDATQSTSSGCFGSVSKVKYEGDVRALKCIKLEREVNVQTFVNEFRAYNEIRCNNIVRFYGICAQQRPPQLYILMEYMPGGNLQDVIREKRDLSLRRKLDWLAAIAKGLKCIHRKRFVHKDIKPDNILLTGHGGVKIGDMGTAIFDNGKYYFRDSLASFRYSAPEVLSGDKFTNKVDMFSFGLVMNELLTYTPYPGKIPMVPIRFVVKTELLGSFVESCVSGDPDERPSAAQTVEKLETLGKGFWSTLESPQAYMELTTSEKDELFLQFYKKKDLVAVVAGVSDFSFLKRGLGVLSLLVVSFTFLLGRISWFQEISLVILISVITRISLAYRTH